jgi:biotin carboxyl carrier protein
VHQSRCADVRVPDDAAAIRFLREEVARLPGSAVAFYRHGSEPDEPRFAPSELSALFPADPRRPYDIEDVLARLVDGSLFHEVLPAIGREIVTGIARVSGLWVGFVANRQGIVEEPGHGRRAGGVLYREGIAKITTFARACDDDGIPVVWLQDISGFDIGVEAERLGLLGYGSNLIYTNSTVHTPFFTVLLRKASGAGYYALSGLPYEPVVQLSTPFSRLAVMEGRTLAIATYNSKLDDSFEIASADPAERSAIEQGMAETAARIEADMDPVRAASVMDTDEVVPVSRLRDWLVCLVESAWQSFGYRRTKNPRIWSLHDLEALGGSARPAEPIEAEARNDDLRAPTVGTFTPAGGEDTTLSGGTVLGHLDRAGARHAVLVPDAVSGAASDVAPAGSWVEYGTLLARVGATRSRSRSAKKSAAGEVAEAPPGTTIVRADTDGTFHARREPTAPPFVTEGARVEKAATLGLVEVMKTFTPIRTSAAGTVSRIFVKDGASVQAGQTLFWIT